MHRARSPRRGRPVRRTISDSVRCSSTRIATSIFPSSPPTAGVLAAMAAARVTHALCIWVNLPDWPARARARARAREPLRDRRRASGLRGHAGADGRRPGRARARPKVVAIGETGLDYYRLTGDLEWQRERFRTHIRAARRARKPLVDPHARRRRGHARDHARRGRGRGGRRDALLHRDLGCRAGGARPRLPHFVLRHRDLQERARR